MRHACSLAVTGMVAVFGAGLLIGCAPAGAMTKQQLQTKALAISDMPSGWSVDNSTSGGLAGVTGCLTELRALKNAQRGVTRVEVSYKDGTAPAMSETLLSGSGAAARYAKYVKTLNGCTSVSLTTSDGTASGSVGAMSFPTVGNSSSAYALTLTLQGVNVGIDIVMFRVGKVLGDITYEDLGTPDASTVQGFADQAASKVEAKD
jgi:hypothetical protein